MDHSGGRQDRLHHHQAALGKWLRREFNARLRDELLDGEIFYTLREAQIVIESWRRHFNTIRPHELLGYNARTGSVRACLCRVTGCATPISFASHALASATANSQLTFHLNHSMGAD